MSGRRIVDDAVAQDEDGAWVRRQIATVARFRVRVVSNRSPMRNHQRGDGVDFEVVVDKDLELWARPFGSDIAFRKDEENGGVALIMLENVTAGITHRIDMLTRPGDVKTKWACVCGKLGARWQAHEEAAFEGERHLEEEAQRAQAADRASARYLAERAKPSP